MWKGVNITGLDLALALQYVARVIDLETMSQEFTRIHTFWQKGVNPCKFPLIGID